MSDQRGRGTARGGGGPRGRGRGGDFGGRGGGRGFHGDFGSRGGGPPARGGGRGGGGGGGGRPDPFAGDEPSFGQRQGIPQPDQQVTDLENKALLEAGMTQLSLKPHRAETDFFPCRPAFGSKGVEVTLWANYFKLAVNPREQTFSKYSLYVLRVRDPDDPKPKSKAKGRGKPEPAAGPSGQASADDDEVKGKKLEVVVELALQEIRSRFPDAQYATEYKNQVISRGQLTLPPNNIVRVQHQQPNRDRVDRYDVKFIGPNAISIGDLMRYLETMHDPADPQGQSFPKFEEAIDTIGIILGHTPRSSAQISAVGKGRFFPMNIPSEVGGLGERGLLSIIRGFFQSARPATGRLLLNVNVTHGIFRPSGKLPDILDKAGLGRMDEMQGMRPWERNKVIDDLARLSRILARARIRCLITGQDGKVVVVEKTIAGFAQSSDFMKDDRRQSPQFQNNARFGSPWQVRFFLKPSQPPLPGLAGGQFHTVGDYFQKRYNITLQRRYPLVNTGTTGNPVYYPAEFCEILPGQAVKGKLTADQSKDMINFACRSPFKNATSISGIARQVLSLNAANPVLKGFGVSVGDQLVTVKGRQLNSPPIVYNGARGKQSTKTDNGTWNMMDVRFVKQGKKINSWTWIYIHDPRLQTDPAQIKPTVQDFSRFIIEGMGVNMERRPLHEDGLVLTLTRDSCERQIDSELEALKKSGRLPEFALVIMPADNNTEPYNAIKYLADCKYGFHTSCVVGKKFFKGDRSYFANVALKINLKFGGVNHHLRDELGIVQNGKTMVVGWDVIHPTNLASDSEDLPSQVGLVASIDKDLAQWPSVYWSQDSRVEMLDDKLTEKFASRLKLWHAKNRDYPENIVIFRDGVSEGQFKLVLETELPKIRKACQQLYPATRKPRISIIVSVKRHQTRFYPTDPRMTTKSRNIRNGTVVDRGITQAKLWEFFLTAHTALQGTARPARYVVLLDEVFRFTKGKEAANELERVTHDLCYLFGRATKAVSICPPAYYADIVCTRARVHQASLFESSTAGSVMSATATQAILDRHVHANLRDSMYYI